jgi:outer membrane protein assembly factor BamB
MKPGKVKIGKPNELSLVEIIQDRDYLYGKISISSNKQFSTVFKDGHLDVSQESRRWVNGQVCLIEEDNLLWLKDFERPVNTAVADDGKVVVLFSKYINHSTISGDKTKLESEIVVIEKSGQRIFDYHFDSYNHACAISPNGALVFVSTLSPDDSIYCFNVSEKRLLWKYRNHSRKRVLGLEFSDGKILVFSGASISTRKHEYELTLDGKLTSEYQQSFEKISELCKSPETIPQLLEFLSSTNRGIVIKTLTTIQSFIYNKKSKALLPLIVKKLQPLIKSQDEEIFDLVWKILTKIAERSDPSTIDDVIPELISRIKEINPRYKDVSLWYFDTLARLNPVWLKNEIPSIQNLLETSTVHNEKRFAESIIHEFNKKSGKLELNKFKTSDKPINPKIVNTFKVKTKDHLVSLNENCLTARIGWTNPSKIVELDLDFKEKWKVSINGRVRAIRSDHYGVVVSESSFIKNPQSTMNVGENDLNGKFLSNLYNIENDGAIKKILSDVEGFISLAGISKEKIVIWNDLTLSISCLNRNDGSLLWSRSYGNLIQNKYAMRILDYSSNLDKILTVRTMNNSKSLVIPSIVSTIDGNGKLISEFETDGFPSSEQIKELKGEHNLGGISFAIPFQTHYPIYHAVFNSDGRKIITGDYNGNVACWKVDGKLEWVFNCKNKVKLGLAIAKNGLISALCENGNFFIIKDGKELAHSVIDIDLKNSYHVFSLDNYLGLVYDKNILFFDQNGLVGGLEFVDKIRAIGVDPRSEKLVVSTGDLSLVTIV